LVILFVSVVWSGISFNLWSDYRNAEENAAKDSINLARSFGENITRTVEAVDQTLLFVREIYQQSRGAFDLGPWARGRTFLNESQVQIAVADRNGQVLWSNLRAGDTGVNVADREHFRIQRDSRDDGLYVSGPVLGRVSNRWAIQFVRKLSGPDGTFDGIVVVSIDPIYLSRFYESIAIDNGSIMLLNTDGVVLARAPGAGCYIGTILPPALRDRMVSVESGTYRARSSIDGIERIFSFRRVDRYPMVVNVGLATQDVFAEYERKRQIYVATGLMLSGAAVAVGMIMVRQRRSILDSQQALSVTLESMSQGITMIREDGSVPVINRRAIELLGLPPELLARNPTFQEIIDWQFENQEFGDSKTWSPTLAQVMQSARSMDSDYAYERTRPNGTVLEVRTHALPAGGIVRTFTDITERKRNEEALAAAQSRAAQAERLQALGQLAGGIAHDFNNILQAVQGSACLTETRAEDPAAVRRFARMIQDVAGRGTSITHRLLAFARRGELQAEAVDVAALLDGMRDVLSHTLGSHIRVRADLAEDLPLLLADKGQLETVLVNLAANARDAMAEGGTLTLAASVDHVAEGAAHPADLRAGRYICLSVADTGAGMDAATLSRVMEPFFTTKPRGKGTGLGLPMAKGFVEQSGGGLTIESHPGQGTTVRLWLPAAAHDQTGPVSADIAQRSDDRPATRILLVDDETLVRETLATSLEDAGYVVLTAAGGEEALSHLDTGAGVDVLVTDLSMPGMGGLTVIREARRRRPGLPSVLLTGYAGDEVQEAVGGVLNSAFSLLRKPVTAAELAVCVDALLTGSATGAVDIGSSPRGLRSGAEQG